MEKRTLKKSQILPIVLLCFIIGGIGAVVVYLNDGYEAAELAEFSLLSDENVTVEKIEDAIVFTPKTPQEALIFYPGGKVAHEAYASLMRAYAEEGVLCILLEMPFDLAVLDMNGANGYRELYPEITEWYVGGHSLGGAMAASYLEKHTEEYEGLILCAAYSTVDYSDTDLAVISMYGSNDKVLNAEKYQESKANLPKDYAEFVIEGGNHAFFGSYGLQEGDGIAAITNEEQIAITVEFTLKNIRE